MSAVFYSTPRTTGRMPVAFPQKNTEKTNMIEFTEPNWIAASQIPPANPTAFLLTPEADDLQLNPGALSGFSEGLQALDGNDTVRGSEDNEVMNGNRNDDFLLGGLGQDFLRGGKDFDELRGDEGEDTLLGDREDDFVYGGEGNDSLRGGKDLDFLDGGPGDDEVLGDLEADILIGGPGLDTLTGGNDPNGSGDGAADIFRLATGEGTDIVTDFEPGLDLIELPLGVSVDDIQIRAAEPNSTVIAIAATGEELAVLNNIAPNTVNESSFVDPAAQEDERRFSGVNESLAPIFGNSTIESSLIENDPDNPLRLGAVADDYGLTEVAAGQRIQVNLNTSEFSPSIQLLDKVTDELIAEGGATLDFTVERTRDYIIRITSAGPNELGNYVVTTSASDPIVGNLALGDTVNGDLSVGDLSQLSRPGSFSDDYRLGGLTAGQQVEIALNSSEFDGYLQLINADTGLHLAFNDNADNNTTDAAINFTAQDAVNYIVRVTSFAPDETGNYTLGASDRGQPNIGTNETVFGILDFRDADDPNNIGMEFEEYALTGATGGEQLRVNLESDDFNTYLQVIDATSGQVVIENDDVNWEMALFNSEVSLTVDANTDYLLRVINTQGSGRYRLVTTLEDGDWFAENLQEPAVQNLARQGASDGSLGRGDLLSIYNEVSGDGTVSATEINDIRRLNNNDTRLRMPTSTNSWSQRVTQLVPAGAGSDRFQPIFTLLVGEPAEGPPPAEFNNKDTKTTYKFDYVELTGSLFGGTDANGGTGGVPSISHIDQGGFGDCSVLGTLGATFTFPSFETEVTSVLFDEPLVDRDNDGDIDNDDYLQLPALLQQPTSAIVPNMIRELDDNNDRTTDRYQVRFYTAPGQQVWVTVPDKDVAVLKNAFKPDGTTDEKYNWRKGTIFGATIDGNDLTNPRGAVERSNANPDNWPIWVPIVQRAYAIFRQQEKVLRNSGEQLEGGDNGWDLIGNGNNIGDTLLHITGRGAAAYLNTKRYSGSAPLPQNLDFASDADFSFDLLEAAVANPDVYVVAGTPGSKKGKKGKASNGKLLSDHAYSVIGTYSDIDGFHVVVRNPWGVDNDSCKMVEGKNCKDDDGNPIAYDPNSFSGYKWDGLIDLTYDEFVAGFSDVAIGSR